jgi:phage-related holin
MPNVEVIWQVVCSRSLRLAAFCWAAICYLLEPDAAFMAVMVTVFLDFLTKLIALARQNEGFSLAISNGSISSKKALWGTMIKLAAYFSLGVVATQVKHVVSLESAAVLTKSVVYSFLFMVETISILENLVEGGLTHLAPLLNSARNALENSKRSINNSGS